MAQARQPHIAVIGAGAFGGWTALFLRRQGARVTLVDAWGPGNSRASSGGETRVIRATYGPRAIYTKMAARALTLWKEHQTRWQRQLYHGIGVLWLVESDEPYEKAALPIPARRARHVRGAAGPRSRAALPANQLRAGSLGDPRERGRVSHCPARVRRGARGLPRRGR